MATLVPEVIVDTGLEATFAAADVAGDEFVNEGNHFIEVVNADASPMTVTIVTQQTVNSLAIADQTVVVTNGERRHIGPFPKSLYNDVDSKVQITYTSVTSLTIGVFQFIATG